MRARIEQAALGPLYRVIMALRNAFWMVSQPNLIGVRVLIIGEAGVLLIRHRAGRRPWSLPGGGVNRHERIIDAAVREAHEETGVAVQISHLQGIYDNFHHNTTNCISVFVAAPHGPPNPPRSLEIAEARFFSLNALPDGLDQGSRRRIAEYLKGTRGITALW